MSDEFTVAATKVLWVVNAALVGFLAGKAILWVAAQAMAWAMY